MPRSKKILSQCKGPGPNPDEPTPECIQAFNAVVDEKGACGADSTLDDCCSALAGLGTCLDSILTAMEQDPKYADMLKTL